MSDDDKVWEALGEISKQRRATRRAVLKIMLIILVSYGIAWMIGNSKMVTNDLPEFGVSFEMAQTWSEGNPGNDVDFVFHDGISDFVGDVYKSSKLPEGRTRKGWLKELDEEFLRPCTNVQMISQYQYERNVDGKSITATLYSCVYNGKKYYCYPYWIEFDNSEKFIWGAFMTPLRGNADKHARKWDVILDSAKLTA